ncbi:unnamed protein product [Chilo suppressalis]|uniref:DH domain-containing protein n=1 Tax=Chilo suppressalis TaxID=168631 RepID=A0ABN8BAI2_CHISP|nr:unnamed protein product [Chilo suppressalis]
MDTLKNKLQDNCFSSRAASQSEWSDEEEPLAPQWADSLPAHVLDSLQLSSRLRKRQEVIHESAPALLPPDDLKALFPNLPEVRDWHQALHQRLRAARNAAPAHQLSLRALAQALLGTRLALESLRERRRKNKELHQFLSSREQLPLCGRLQLRDLLACVWQRLTKYRLLLESVLKTVSEDEDSAEDVELLQKSLDSAKDMLLSVDQAIRTTENEHSWVNCIQEAPLARVELKQTITPSHQPSRSTDDEDASEKSNPVVTDEPESDKDGTPAPIQAERDNTPVPAPTDNGDEEENTDSVAKEKEDSGECEEKIAAEAHVATTLRATRQSSVESSDEDGADCPDIRQLLLAAHAQGNVYIYMRTAPTVPTYGSCCWRRTRKVMYIYIYEDGADCPDIRQLLLAAHAQDYQMTDEIYFLKPDAEQPIQDQPSNGG